ncbi:MAG: AAA family ATPase [Planctomycetota bacterium]
MVDSTRHDVARLTALLRAGHPCIRIETTEEDHAIDLINGAVLGVEFPYWVWSITQGIRQGIIAGGRPLDDSEHPAAALFHLAHQTATPVVCLMHDLAPHLSDDRTLRALRDAIHMCRERGGTIILLDHDSSLPTVIEQTSTPFEITLPDEDELESLVKKTLRVANREHEIDVRISRSQLRLLIRNLRGLSRSQATQIIRDAVVHDRCFDEHDVSQALADKRRLLHRDGLLDFVETPADLSSIGGMRELKSWLKEREHGFDADATEYGIEPPRGILLLGVQGAGKSLCAKAVAAAWQRPLLRLDPGSLYDRFVGESERRLRMALRSAEAMSPIVLWIDEIEKGFASAATHSTDGGLSQRMFGSLLTWMQEHREPVFLIATANNIDALPPELLRKGRFDEIFFVDLPKTSVRKQILSIHLKQRGRDPKAFDLNRLAAVSAGYSGAEIEQAIIASLHSAYATGKDVDELSTDDVAQALLETTPLSVTMAEQVNRLRQWAADRCRPAD